MNLSQSPHNKGSLIVSLVTKLEAAEAELERREGMINANIIEIIGKEAETEAWKEIAEALFRGLESTRAYWGVYGPEQLKHVRAAMNAYQKATGYDPDQPITKGTNENHTEIPAPQKR